MARVLPTVTAAACLLLLPTVAAAAACPLLRSSNSTDVFLLSSSASLSPLLFGDALEPFALRFSDLLAAIVLHRPVEVAFDVV
ncbi:MAG: hypothetical protein GY772_17340 [bacterium]|nr:hypothetical protein [bacterium]